LVYDGFPAGFEQNGFYFASDKGDFKIKQKVSFRHRNELKITSQKRIGFYQRFGA
jgi:hypothetical protein